MSGHIEAVVTRTPSADTKAAVERLSEFLTRAGIMMRVRHEILSGLGPALRIEVRDLGSLSHLHIDALEQILSRTIASYGVVIVVNHGRRRFVLPHDSEACMRWFRDDRRSGVWSRMLGRLLP